MEAAGLKAAGRGRRHAVVSTVRRDELLDAVVDDVRRPGDRAAGRCATSPPRSARATACSCTTSARGRR